MVQVEALSIPECQEGVLSPGGQQEGEQGEVQTLNSKFLGLSLPCRLRLFFPHEFY